MALRTHNLPSGRLEKRLSKSRWNDFSKNWQAMRTKFLDTGQRKKPPGRSCLREILSRRMALRTYNLPSRSLKNRLWWSRSDVSRCRKTVKPHCLHTEHRKKGLGWIHVSEVFSRTMAQRIHNLPSKCLKMRPVLIQGVLRPFELIFYILDIQKRDLVEVAEVMI
jgi:hypothetical protein